MSPRETILEALRLALVGIPGARVLRNEPLPGRIPAGGMVILRDGDPGQPEVTLSPLRYHYEHRAGIDVLIQKAAGRDMAFDALCAAIGARIAADRTLGGLCDWCEAEAPEPVEITAEGGEPIKAATVAVILTYSTADPL
jgi:hypothetical protein